MNWASFECYSDEETVFNAMEQKSAVRRPRANNRTGENLLKRKNALIWSGICLGVGFWMFCLGILVGRGSEPVQFDIPALQKELSELKKAALEKTWQRYQTDSKKAGSKKDLEFYETLPGAQDVSPPSSASAQAGTRLAAGEKPTMQKPPAGLAETVTPAEPKEAAAETRSPNTAAPLKVRAAIFKKIKPDVTAEPPSAASAKSSTPSAPSPRSAPSPPSAPSLPTAWTIQVAALKDAGEADRMVSQLAQKGYPAYKLTGEIPGKGVWHRVRVGRYQKREETATVIDRLVNDQYAPIPLNTGGAAP